MDPFTIRTASVRILCAGGPVASSVAADRCRVGTRAIVLVHGFNNTEGWAENSYAAIIANLRALADRALPPAAYDIVKFYWPGDESWGPFSFASYPTEIADANESAERLLEFLAGPGGYDEVSFVGHSLGCRLILETLRRAWSGGGTPGFPPCRAVILAAAAVPLQYVAANGHLAITDDFVGWSRIRFSPDDLTLRFAFPAGQTLAGEPAVEAIGLQGNPLDYGESRMVLQGAGHGDYWKAESVARDVLVGLSVALPHRVPEYASPTHRLPSGADRAYVACRK